MLDVVLFIGKNIDRRKANAAKKANYDSDQLRIVININYIYSIRNINITDYSCYLLFVFKTN